MKWIDKSDGFDGSNIWMCSKCGLEWYFDDAFGLSFSVSYSQNLRKSPFSPDLLHDAYFGINAGLVFSLF